MNGGASKKNCVSNVACSPAAWASFSLLALRPDGFRPAALADVLRDGPPSKPGANRVRSACRLAILQRRSSTDRWPADNRRRSAVSPPPRPGWQPRAGTPRACARCPANAPARAAPVRSQLSHLATGIERLLPRLLRQMTHIDLFPRGNSARARRSSPSVLDIHFDGALSRQPGNDCRIDDGWSDALDLGLCHVRPELQRKTTVRLPFNKIRCSTCHFTARASTAHSTSRPTAAQSSALME